MPGVLVCRSDSVGQCRAWHRALFKLMTSAAQLVIWKVFNVRQGRCFTGLILATGPSTSGHPELLQALALGKAAAGACFLLRHLHGRTWPQAVPCGLAGSVSPICRGTRPSDAILACCCAGPCWELRPAFPTPGWACQHMPAPGAAPILGTMARPCAALWASRLRPGAAHIA